MKTLKSILIIWIVSLCAMGTAMAAKQTVTFNVLMHCHSCEQKITKGFADTQGVLNLKTDLRSNTVAVTFNPDKTDVAKITERFRQIGYAAYPVGENCSTKKGGCLNNAATQPNTMK